jgi:hypothetical protein
MLTVSCDENTFLAVYDGTISGSVMGGYLAEPSKKLPAVFPPDSIWGAFPYLLPNLVVVVSLSISCTLGLIFLREAHPHFRDQEAG